MLGSCIEFIDSFAALNPFDLAHFTEILLVQFEDLLLNRQSDEKLQFTQQDIKHAFIRTMRVLKVEMAEEQIAEAQNHLQTVQRQIYMPRKITK